MVDGINTSNSFFGETEMPKTKKHKVGADREVEDLKFSNNRHIDNQMVKLAQQELAAEIDRELFNRIRKGMDGSDLTDLLKEYENE